MESSGQQMKKYSEKESKHINYHHLNRCSIRDILNHKNLSDGTKLKTKSQMNSLLLLDEFIETTIGSQPKSLLSKTHYNKQSIH